MLEKLNLAANNEAERKHKLGKQAQVNVFETPKVGNQISQETRRAERASNLTFSKCLHFVDLNIPRILMTHDKMAVTASIRA